MQLEHWITLAAVALNLGGGAYWWIKTRQAEQERFLWHDRGLALIEATSRMKKLERRVRRIKVQREIATHEIVDSYLPEEVFMSEIIGQMKQEALGMVELHVVKITDPATSFLGDRVAYELRLDVLLPDTSS